MKLNLPCGDTFNWKRETVVDCAKCDFKFILGSNLVRQIKKMIRSGNSECKIFCYMGPLVDHYKGAQSSEESESENEDTDMEEEIIKRNGEIH